MRKILFQEADFYGASKLIFIDEPTPICYRATWMHGLGFVFHDNIDHKILIHYNEDNLPIHLVNNSESVELLNSEGVSSIAVGMPYIYTKAYTNNQRQKILYKRVFMPGHIISGVNIKHDYSKWKILFLSMIATLFVWQVLNIMM